MQGECEKNVNDKRFVFLDVDVEPSGTVQSVGQSRFKSAHSRMVYISHRTFKTPSETL